MTTIGNYEQLENLPIIVIEGEIKAYLHLSSIVNKARKVKRLLFLGRESYLNDTEINPVAMTTIAEWAINSSSNSRHPFRHPTAEYSIISFFCKYN